MSGPELSVCLPWSLAAATGTGRRGAKPGYYTAAPEARAAQAGSLPNSTET